MSQVPTDSEPEHPNKPTRRRCLLPTPTRNAERPSKTFQTHLTKTPFVHSKRIDAIFPCSMAKSTSKCRPALKNLERSRKILKNLEQTQKIIMAIDPMLLHSPQHRFPCNAHDFSCLGHPHFETGPTGSCTLPTNVIKIVLRPTCRFTVSQYGTSRRTLGPAPTL